MNNDILRTVKQHFKIAAFPFLFILLTVGCGNVASSSSNGGNGTGTATSTGTSTGTGTGTGTGTDTGTGTSTGTATGLGLLGINTKTIAHASWVSTAPHSTFLCNDCHTVDNEVICSQSGCHPFSKYAALATNFDHVANTTGDWCNKCHSMIPEPAATDAVRIAGWREHVKSQLSDTIWHPGLKGACLNCHDPVKHDAMATMPNFPTSHLADTSRHTACETCHFYKLNGAGTSGVWGYTPHPTVTTGCATATCHTHLKTTTETHYMGGTAPAGQHYDANTGGPFSCEWCHSGAISSNYTSWAVAFDKTTHQSWNSGACKACHPTGTHPTVTTGCATATCHTHIKTTTETHYMGGTAPAGQHYDANTGGPFSCEWCHSGAISSNYTSWAVAFDKTTHQSWNSGACKACHPTGTHPTVTTGCATATCHTHLKTTTETHYMGGTAPAGQHYDANTGGPFSCEWCHSSAISSNYTSWAVAFDKTTHQSWNSGACTACHPSGGAHPAVTTGCRTATCHMHTKPTTQTHQESGYVAGQHYDANAGGSVGAGPFECEWCHKTVASGGYTSWSLTFSKSGHRKGTSKWDVRACGACHPNRIPD